MAPEAPTQASGGLDPEMLALLAESGVDMSTLGGGLEQPEIIGGIAAPTTASTPQNVTRGSVRGGGAQIYRDGDEVDVLQRIPLELRVKLQEQMMALGIPGTSNIIVGELDDATTNGLRVLMALGNRSGTSWDATLNRLQSRYDEGLLSGAGDIKIKPYIPPDYASLAQTAKEAVRSRLGFDPSDAEMTLLADELSSLHRKSYDADVQAIRDEGAGRSVTAPEVDVASRFQSFFEEKFAPQIAVVDEGAQVSESANEAQAQLGNVARQVGV